MRNRHKCLIFILALSMASIACINLQAQDRLTAYHVDSVILSYKVSKGIDQSISKGNTLFLTDSVKVTSENGFDGYLGLHSSDGKTYAVFSPKGPCQLRNAIFSNALSTIAKGVKGFMNGLFSPVEVTMAALRHHWGETDNLAEGLAVRFVRNNQVYGSFRDTPCEEPCEILMTNTSDSVRVYSLVFQYKTKESNPLRSIVVDRTPEGDPFILVPGETAKISLPFVRPRGYFVYYLNIFGGTRFFVVNVRGDSPVQAKLFAENEDLNYSRFYFESDE